MWTFIHVSTSTSLWHWIFFFFSLFSLQLFFYEAPLFFPWRLCCSLWGPHHLFQFHMRPPCFFHEAYVAHYEAHIVYFNFIWGPLILALVTSSLSEAPPINYFHEAPLFLSRDLCYSLLGPSSFILTSYEDEAPLNLALVTISLSEAPAFYYFYEASLFLSRGL